MGREPLKAEKKRENKESLLFILTALMYAGFVIAGLVCYVFIFLIAGL